MLVSFHPDSTCFDFDEEHESSLISTSIVLYHSISKRFCRISLEWRQSFPSRAGRIGEGQLHGPDVVVALIVSGTISRGKVRSFSVWREEDSYRVYDLRTFAVRWPAKTFRKATEENVRKEMAREFHLSNVTIERVKFQRLPGYS
jgi:hypothetical protein